MLLGQAESGKSTLQKQFQLYYASQSLDHERPSWRPIVYFNVLKALRMILDEIDVSYPQAMHQPSSSGSSSYSPVSTANSTAGVFSFTSPQQSTSPKKLKSKDSQSPPTTVNCPDPNWFPELNYLRSKILPLVASEEALASELSGGITLSGGRTGVYVRTGWQALVTGSRAWPIAGSGSGGGIGSVPRASAVTNIVAKTLQATKDEIYGLWRHPGVLALLRDGKLRLEESASL